MPDWIPVEKLGGTLEIRPFSDYLLPFLITMPLSILILAMVGFYDRPLLSGRRLTIIIALKACLLTPIGLIIIMYLSKDYGNIARSVPIIFSLVSFCFLLLKEEVNRYLLNDSISKGHFRKRVVVVGSESTIGDFKDLLNDKGQTEVEISAVFDPKNSDVRELPKTIHEHSANAVVISGKNILLGEIEKIIHACELEGLEVWLLADFIKANISRTSLDDLYGHPTLVFRSAPDLDWQSIAKRVLDFTGALTLLIILAIPLVIVSLLVRMTSPGPIFFSQMRSGLNGKPFRMFKFRSMVTNAEQLHLGVCALLGQANAPLKRPLLLALRAAARRAPPGHA